MPDDREDEDEEDANMAGLTRPRTTVMDNDDDDEEVDFDQAEDPGDVEEVFVRDVSKPTQSCSSRDLVVGNRFRRHGDIRCSIADECWRTEDSCRYYLCKTRERRDGQRYRH